MSQPMVARLAASLAGFVALAPHLAVAGIRAEVPPLESNPTLISAPAGAPSKEQTKPYKKLSLEELMNTWQF